jgi:hypothetical protein
MKKSIKTEKVPALLERLATDIETLKLSGNCKCEFHKGFYSGLMMAAERLRYFAEDYGK